MMSDDEIKEAIETLTQLTGEDELRWVQSEDGKRLITTELEGFSVTLVNHEPRFELSIDDDHSGPAAHISAKDNINNELQGKLYTLFLTAEGKSGSEESRRFQDSARRRSQRGPGQTR